MNRFGPQNTAAHMQPPAEIRISIKMDVRTNNVSVDVKPAALHPITALQILVNAQIAMLAKMAELESMLIGRGGASYPLNREQGDSAGNTEQENERGESNHGTKAENHD